MRVKLWPDFGTESGQGGIKRVWEAEKKWLPTLGVELVNDIKLADVVNVHADEIKTDKPVAFSCHGLYWAGYSWDSWCYESNAKIIRMMKHAGSVSAPTKWVANSLSRGMLLDPFVLPHGVEIEEFRPTKDLGYVLWSKTRQDPICDPKSLNILATLAPEIPFISTFGDQQPNVKILGKVNYDQSKVLLSNAAIFLATTLETGAINLLEAAASCVPALGWNFGANSELVIHKETGWLAEPEDYNGLLEGLYYCLANRKRLGEAARELVYSQYQWKDRISDYISFFESAIVPRHQVKVSVIITAYNLEKYLPASIESVLNQTFKDFEIIIVDDNSPDRCGKIADHYAEKDSRIKVIHNPTNRYLAEARNIGISHSTGEYVISLDADDMLSPQALEIMVGKMEADKTIDIATGGFELIEPDGRHWQSGWPAANPTYDYQIQNHNQVPYASLMRRWVWERTGGYRRRMKSAEDAEFWSRVYSYGAVPAKVTDVPTLIYSNRPNSMSHQIATPDYNRWLTWRKYPEFTPFGCSGTPPEGRPAWPVLPYGPTRISAVIPCGPSHDVFLQDCLDSIVAQTMQDWEIIVVNDTGSKWLDGEGNLINRYLKGYPFITIVDSKGGAKGPAWARNQGIKQAKAEYIFFLDADDYAQPLSLDVLYKTVQQFGGYAYGDFYDQEGNYKETLDWDCEYLKTQMLGPTIGLFKKTDLELIGGFDETLAGFEDWDVQLSLLEHGICATRIKYPVFTYRYHTGTRRENDFKLASELVQVMRKKHKKLYT